MEQALKTGNQKLVMIATLGLAATVAFAGPHDMDHGKGKKPGDGKPTLPNCPVMGEPVDFSVKTMTKEGPVYFCCKMCIKKFNDEPSKYTQGLSEQKKALAKLPKVQVTCPVSGEPIDTKVFIEERGKKTYFCCKGCIDKYKKDPAKFAAKLADSYSYQTKCPVMNGEIDPGTFITLKTGQTIYFCCKGCDKKFLKDPAKYAPKLAEQGVHIDPKKVEVAPEATSKNATKSSGDDGDSHKKHEGHDHDH